MYETLKEYDSIFLIHSKYICLEARNLLLQGEVHSGGEKKGKGDTKSVFIT